MKVLFRKSPDECSSQPRIKDFHMDPEQRKYVFAEEYVDQGSGGSRPSRRRQMASTERGKEPRRVTPHQPKASADIKIESEEEQMEALRRRLEDTEAAMERLMGQMGNVSDKLSQAKLSEVLMQAQTQAQTIKGGLDSIASIIPSSD